MEVASWLLRLTLLPELKMCEAPLCEVSRWGLLLTCGGGGGRPQQVERHTWTLRLEWRDSNDYEFGELEGKS
jgi:hypothetical protein